MLRMRVDSQLALGLWLRGTPWRQAGQRATATLQQFELQELAARRAHTLSGGQQQRVAIARALMNDPDIIMGDEPTGNLDSYNSGLVLEMFRELTRVKGQTLIAVTHDLDFAKSSDRIVEMQDGKILR